MSGGSADAGTRYHAFDCLRAMAMLLGVFYHSIQTGMMNGAEWGASSWIASLVLTEWLHSFRMPLFFAISGFFCHMMLCKYGIRDYLIKRWWRIGTPMVVALIALSLLRIATQPVNLPDFSRGDRNQENVVAASKGPHLGPQLPGKPGAAPIDFSRFMPRVGPIATALFGDRANQFILGALWFLWYLLVFATIAPFVSSAIGWVFQRPTPAAADRMGKMAIRLGIVPLLLGLLSTPALIQTRGLFGWSLGFAEAIFVTFPDVLFQYQIDMPYYFVYFLMGWWLYRLRDSLPDLASLWLPNFILGCITFVVAASLSGIYASQTDLRYYEVLRLTAYSIYATSTAFTVWGFLGFFLAMSITRLALAVILPTQHSGFI